MVATGTTQHYTRNLVDTRRQAAFCSGGKAVSSDSRGSASGADKEGSSRRNMAAVLQLLRSVAPTAGDTRCIVPG